MKYRDPDSLEALKEDERNWDVHHDEVTDKEKVQHEEEEQKLQEFIERLMREDSGEIWDTGVCEPPPAQILRATPKMRYVIEFR